jgi:hypothetical protein
VLTEAGPVAISVPQDRHSSFEPKIVAKRQLRLTGVEDCRRAEPQIKELSCKSCCPSSLIQASSSFLILLRRFVTINPWFPASHPCTI